MTRDSTELQALEDGVDAAVPEKQVFGPLDGIGIGKDWNGPQDTLPDPAAGLKAYLSKIDR
mgnify:CR=1 FL=1